MIVDRAPSPEKVPLYLELIGVSLLGAICIVPYSFLAVVDLLLRNYFTVFVFLQDYAASVLFIVLTEPMPLIFQPGSLEPISILIFIDAFPLHFTHEELAFVGGTIGVD